jgi:hypothetical protein
LSDVRLANIFFHSVGGLFSLETVSFVVPNTTKEFYEVPFVHSFS